MISSQPYGKTFTVCGMGKSFLFVSRKSQGKTTNFHNFKNYSQQCLVKEKLKLFLHLQMRFAFAFATLKCNLHDFRRCKKFISFPAQSRLLGFFHASKLFAKSSRDFRLVKSLCAVSKCHLCLERMHTRAQRKKSIYSISKSHLSCVFMNANCLLFS